MKAMNILEKIINNKKTELIQQKKAVPISVLEKFIEEREYKSLSFKNALKDSSTGIIAEFKRKSPSKGWIYEKASVQDIVTNYQNSGASSISVLTDGDFFGGSFTDLTSARQILNIPLLRKDFMVDEYQLYQAKAMGADVVLLIAAALSLDESRQLSEVAKKIGLEVLLEIHSEEELEYIQLNIDVVGINNRDLTTFITDTKRSFDLGEKIPDHFVKISESGISDTKTVKDLRDAGFRGFLMGENFMKTSDPGKALSDFISGVVN